MDAKLMLLSDPARPIFAIDAEEVLIGRDASCRIRLANMMVSQRHCRLTVCGDRLFAEDVGSTHGTAVNQVTLKHSEPVEIRHGDHLWIGPEHFQLAVGRAALPEAQPLDWINPLTSEGKRAVQARAAGRVWERFLGRFRAKEGPSAIEEDSGRSLIRIKEESEPKVTVVEVIPRVVANEGDVSQLFEELDDIVASGRQRVLLHLGNVEHVSKRFLSECLRVDRQCEAKGGILKICKVCDPVASLFRQTSLDQEIEVFRDVKTALGSAWPDASHSSKVDLPFTERSADSSATATMLPRRRVRLVVAIGRARGQVVQVGATQYLIGRDPRCHLRLNDDTVSRLHALLEIRGDRVWVRDLKSGGGTMVNGRTLRAEEAELFEGDSLQIGFLRFSCQIDDLAVAPAKEIDAESPLPSFAARGSSGSSPTLQVLRPEVALAGSEDGAEPGSELKLQNAATSEVVNGVLVVTLHTPKLTDDATISAVRFSLQSLHDKSLPRRLIIRLDNVSFLSRGAVVMLLARHQELEREGGGLRLCHASPSVGSFLEQTQLPMLVDVFPTFEQAIAAPWA